jgi:hypothetical protein
LIGRAKKDKPFHSVPFVIISFPLVVTSVVGWCRLMFFLFLYPSPLSDFLRAVCSSVPERAGRDSSIFSPHRAQKRL